MAVADLNPNDRRKSIIRDVEVIKENFYRNRSPIKSSNQLELPSRKYMTYEDNEKLKELIDHNKSPAELQNERYMKMLEKKAFKNGDH